MNEFFLLKIFTRKMAEDYSLRVREFPAFVHPGNMAIFRPSKSGKSTFIKKLVENRDEVFRPSDPHMPKKFKSVVYYYGSRWQPLFQLLSDEDPSIEFRMGYPQNSMEEEIPAEDRPALVVFDDLESEIEKTPKAANLVTRDSHHLGLFVVIVFQDIFPKGKHSTTIYCNVDTLLYFRYSNNDHAIMTRFRNFYSGGNRVRDLMEIYTKWTGERGGYMVIDNHPDQKEKEVFSIRTNIFPEDLRNLETRVAIMNKSYSSVKRARQPQLGSEQASKRLARDKTDYNGDLFHKIYKQPCYFSKHGQPTFVKDVRMRNRLLYGDDAKRRNLSYV